MENNKINNGDTAKTNESSPKNAKPKRPSVKALQGEIDQLKQELSDVRDKYLRQAAEFDNYRKRKQHESLEYAQSARENLLKNLLPVVDDFERIFKNHGDRDDSDWKGVVLVYEKLLTILRQQGLTPMEPMGKPFDPEYHDALITVPRDDVDAGMVVEVHENGYLMNGRVLRHAKVIVSTKVAKDSNDKKKTVDAAGEE